MTDITLNPEQFEAVLQYALSFGAYQATSDISSLAHARKAWEELRRLGTPVFVLTGLESQVGTLP